LVIHGNYLAADEIDYVGAHADRMSVVYCPRTHAYFQHSRYPLEELLAAGARVALGTDSRASTPDLSLLGEVQGAAAEFPAIEPATFLQMATLDAAQALGLSDQAGSLTPGKRADLIALPCSAGDDPFAAILAAERPEGVWLAGERLVARGAVNASDSHAT
jgi:cytosine/adenosine deaminase-related metal-dependent hydrolase